jgi:hypothetical protein
MEKLVPERGEVRPAAPAAITRPEDHPDWPRVQRWAKACAAGLCKYRSTERIDAHVDGCPGYAGFAHLEEGVVVMRYRSCDRKLRWWRAEQDRIRRRKVSEGRKAVPRDSGWREED